MRPFETLLIIIAALSLLPLLFPRRPSLRRLRWLPLGALLFLFLHLFLEGYRWQMLPAYALVFILVILSLARAPFQTRRPLLRVAMIIISLSWLALAITLPVLLPVPQPLPPTGPYGVGTRTYYLVDESRPEIFSLQVENRELMVQIWYPGQVSAESEPAPFIERIDVAGPAIANRLNLPPFLLGHLDLVRTHAFLDIPITEDQPFPLLVFSHGLRGIRAQNTSLMQQLAGHGYVVASIDHPYANALTIFPGDRIVFFDQETVMPSTMTVTEAGTRLVEVWAQDIAFVTQQLTQWTQETGHPLQGSIDASRIGLLGHSTGGGAAIQACPAIPECDAALALDGWIEPVSEQIRQNPYSPALMLIRAPDSLGPNNGALGDRLYQQRAQSGYLVTVDGTVHFDYTDIPLMSPVTSLIGLSGAIDGPRVVTLVNDYTLAFFDHILKNQPAPLLQPTNTTYPEASLAP